MKTLVKSGFACIDSVENTIKSLRSLGERGFVQVVSAEGVASELHVMAALEQAEEAVKEGSALSKSLDIEFMLRLAGTRHIKEALERVGLKERKGRGVSTAGKQEVVIVAEAKPAREAVRLAKEAGRLVGFKESKGLLEKNLKRNFEALKKAYGVPDSHIEALSDLGKEKALEHLILEKVAMVVFEE